MLQKVGFENAEIVSETGFNSSPKTKGVLLRAEKPAIAMHNQEPTADAKHGDKKVHDSPEKRFKIEAQKC